MAPDGVYAGGMEPYPPTMQGRQPAPSPTSAPPSAPDASGHSAWQQPRRRRNSPELPPQLAQTSWQLAQQHNRSSKTAMIALVVVLAVILVLPVVLTQLMGGPSSPGIDRPRPARESMAPMVEVGVPVEYLDYRGLGTLTVLDTEWFTYEPPYAEATDLLGVRITVTLTEGGAYVSPFSSYAITSDGSRYGAEFVVHPPMTEFEGGDLTAGDTASGWIFFPIPKQDVVFLFNNGEEEVLRVAIEGGPPPPPVKAPITIDESVKVEDYSGQGQLTVLQAAWVQPPGQPMYLTVQLRLSTTVGYLWPIPMDARLVDADGIEHDPTYFALDGYQPRPTYDRICAGDTVTGWLAWEVPREDVELRYVTQWTDELIQIPG